MVAIAVFVVLLVLGAGLFCWTLAFFKLVLGQPLVEWSARRHVPWAIVDLAGMVALYLVVNVAAAVLLRELGWLPQRVELDKLNLAESKSLTLVNSVLSLAILGLGLPLIALRVRATLADFGWSPRELLADVRLGAIAFVMLAPPVYAIQAVLTQIWPSKHPLMEMFRESPDPALFAVLFFAAVVVAPLAEELLFRVLLQGFLEKAFTFRGPLLQLFLGRSDHPELHEDIIVDAELAPEPADMPVAWQPQVDYHNPYLPPAVPAPIGTYHIAAAAPVEGAVPPHAGAAWLPIAITSLIFALLHLPHGPDWIPLIPLAVGMGYLYHRTHRLVPSLTVHALLNGLSMWGLWISVNEAPRL